MNAQVAVVGGGVVRYLAPDDLREFAQLAGVAVGLNAEVYDIASRRIAAGRFRKSHAEREILSVETFDRAEVDRAVRAVHPQTAAGKSAGRA